MSPAVIAVDARSKHRPVRVLDADPDLAEALDPEELEEASRALIAPAVRLAKGDWRPRQAVPPASGHLGVLVTSGVLCREIAVGDTICAELVGPGDLLRPWDGGETRVLVSYDIFWHVLEDATLAILDRRFVDVAARWPPLTSALVGRALARSNSLALAATIRCTTGLETRLLMLFRHMADRWGRVRRDGVVVPVRLTHDLIAHLIGARRPSVSTVLKQLERDGRIVRLHGDGWLLAGDPPGAALAPSHRVSA
jgi:CRP/FNR family cyclic AMP-dependent transcriptional regulator